MLPRSRSGYPRFFDKSSVERDLPKKPDLATESDEKEPQKTAINSQLDLENLDPQLSHLRATKQQITFQDHTEALWAPSGNNEVSHLRGVGYVVFPDGKASQPWASSVVQELQEKGIKVETKPLTFLPSTPVGGAKRAKGPNETPYEEVYRVKRVQADSSSAALTLFKPKTPPKNSHYPGNLVLFQAKPQEELTFKPNSQETFSFTVTRELLRQKKPKRSSQAGLMGLSAKEALASLGAEVGDRRVKGLFHWAHRQGHSLSGKMEEANLDPSTAGSNYMTLHYVERSIKKILLDERVSQVKVHGKVRLHPTHGIAEVIKYIFTWEVEGISMKASKTIYPLRYNRPSYASHTLVSTVNRRGTEQESKVEIETLDDDIEVGCLAEGFGCMNEEQGPEDEALIEEPSASVHFL